MRLTVPVPVPLATDLLQGKLDQRKKAFEVQWVMGRDLGPTEVSDMIATVETWYVGRGELFRCSLNQH